MKILILGGDGQFSQSISKVSVGRATTTTLKSSEVDITIKDEIIRAVKEHRPDFIVNVAAIHSQKDTHNFASKAYTVNAIGSRNVAEVSKLARVPYVFISTDFVFSGRSNSGGLVESDICDSTLDSYAKTKILGEQFALEHGHSTVVWRIASPFGPYSSKAKGHNFLNLVMERLKKGEIVEIVDNIFMSPTYTLDSASRLLELLTSDFSEGIWHGTNSGRASWFEFAAYAADLAHLPPPIPKLADSVRDTSLSVAKFESALSVTVRSWREATSDYLSTARLL